MEPSDQTVWSDTWSRSRDWSPFILRGFNRNDKQGLRGASPISHRVVNDAVRKVVISESADFRELDSLRLHERFPNADTVVLADGCASSSAAPDASPLASLSKMTGITSLDLAECGLMDMAAAAQALAACRGLRELALPVMSADPEAAFHLAAQHTDLTKLELSSVWEDLTAQVLQQLSTLQQLQSFSCTWSSRWQHGALAGLASLTALTSLNLYSCCNLHPDMEDLSPLRKLKRLILECSGDVHSLQGIQQLTALEELRLSAVPPQQQQHLSLLASLTQLTYLDLAWRAPITSSSSAILQLPHLSYLAVRAIDVAAYDSSRCPELTRLDLLEAGSELSKLLPLPRMQVLLIEGGPGDSMDMAAAISSQTSLTSLEADAAEGFQDDVIRHMVAPLQQLRSLYLDPSPQDVTLATMHTIAQLPHLQRLRYSVPHPVEHLLPLIGAGQLTWLKLYGFGSSELKTVLAALMCKPGLQHLEYQHDSNIDDEEPLVPRMAELMGVEVVELF